MLKVSVTKLKEHSEKLQNLIKKYEENSQTIAKELTNSELNWHDDNSSSFFLEIKKNNSQLQIFITELANVSGKYTKVLEAINKIDFSIKSFYVNQEYKSTIIQSYNNSISKIKNIKQKLDNLHMSFCSYSERNIINNEIKRLSNCIEEIEKSKEKVDNMFIDLEKIETLIVDTLSDIEMCKLDLFEYEKYL